MIRNTRLYLKALGRHTRAVDLKLIYIIALLVSRSAFAQAGYDRSDWQRWKGSYSDCQNARLKLLINASLVPVSFTEIELCTIVARVWIGLDTGHVFASDIGVNHISPRKYASDHGGV